MWHSMIVAINIPNDIPFNGLNNSSLFKLWKLRNQLTNIIIKITSTHVPNTIYLTQILNTNH